jgi:trans-2,3-dihydro-3-hydroxyanthranilate isomerase
MALPLTWLDVFTARPLTGNGLAVVHDADAVPDATMLAFARETRLSETTFVQTATESGADYRNRIWMTMRELPFAGHPSLGTAVAVARARGERAASYVQQTGAGLQAIEVELGSDVARASMLQEPAAFGAEVEPAVALRALGLDAGEADPALPPQVVATGLAQLVVPVREPAALDRVAPDAALLRALLEEHGCTCAYLAWLDGDGEAAAARSFFLDGAAVLEDPATGSAAGPLMAYASARTGAVRLAIDQGVAMGRPSRLLCEAGERMRVAGDVVVLFESTVAL